MGKLLGDHGLLFRLATASLLLGFIGIHNAWDTVTFMAAEDGQGEEKPGAMDGDEAGAVAK